MSDLKNRTYHGAFWSAIDAMAARLLQFVIGVILARLLLPEQFGLIGMLAIFVGVSQMLLHAGFSTALIQKSGISDTDTSSVFYFNVLMSILLAGGMYLAAPSIASFYSQPILIVLTRALSLVIVIDAFSVVQTAILTREMRFRIQTKVSLVAALLSGGVGITMAATGFGVWALVGQQLSAALARAVALWRFNTWRPRPLFCVSALRNMFRFGSRMMLSGLLNQVFQNIYYVVIGRLFSPVDLGFYTRARHIEEMPSLTLSGIVSRVSFPAFSAIQNDDERVRRAFRKALRMLAFVNAPVMIGLAVVAEPLVLVLLTERWLPAVPYLQLLCVLGIFLPYHTINLNVLMAKGRSDLFLQLEILKKVFVVISIGILWRWGIMALIAGNVLVSVLGYVVTATYLSRLVGYGLLSQLRDTVIYLLLAAIMGTFVYAMHFVEIESALLLLISQIAVGVFLYSGLCLSIRPPALFDLVDLLRSRFGLGRASTFLRWMALARSTRQS